MADLGFILLSRLMVSSLQSMDNNEFLDSPPITATYDIINLEAKAALKNSVWLLGIMEM